MPFLGSVCLADFEAGRDAYIGGDYRAAYQAFLPLAAQGDAKSRIGLGLLHAHGHGVSRDVVQAHKWFDLAATQTTGSHPIIRILARSNRDYLAKRMSTAQIAESKIRAALIGGEQDRREVQSDGAADSLERISEEAHNYSTRVYGVRPDVHTNARGELAFPTAKPVKIQLAAIRGSRNGKAMTEWNRLSRRHRVLSTLEPSVTRVDLGNKGVFQRLRAGPFDTPAAARYACARLRAEQQACFVVTK
ncbi:MAG: SPOR domain-containing protein [Alphaproteobacteria bacterium]|nr:SPOR domain-containing protein [Alphaproteobacteria bacterium]